MLLPRALLVPHWPTLLEDEHRRHRTPMLEMLAREGRRLLAEQPEIVAVLSARWESTGPFHVGTGRFHRTITDDPAFGVEARYDCTGHPELARALVRAGEAAGVRVGPSDRGVDGGVTVPMHFLVPSRSLKVVPLSIARRPVEECRKWGAVIRRVLEARPERIGLVVGGMLSHATHAWNFRREVPEAGQLDETVLGALKAGEWDSVGQAADKWKQRAHPEAGLRHLEVLRGFLGADLPGEVLCYEAGPGMGAALVAFEVPGAIRMAPPDFELTEIPDVPRMGRERAPAKAQADAFSRPRQERGAERRNGKRYEGVRAGKRGKVDDRRGTRGKPAATPSAGSRGPRGKFSGPPSAGSRAPRGKFSGSSSAGSRTPRPRGRAPASRPARKPRG